MATTVKTMTCFTAAPSVSIAPEPIGYKTLPERNGSFIFSSVEFLHTGDVFFINMAWRLLN
jgi:hypothetical protein